MRKVVIIGGGPAGYEASLAAAANGADVTVVEESAAGGACVLYDCVPSKTFIATTGVKTELRNAERFGLSDSDSHDYKIKLSVINERVKEIATQQSEDIRDQLISQDIKLIEGKARLKGRENYTYLVEVCPKEGDSYILEADIVLIATGASPRILPGAVPDGERILNWREVYNLTELPEHLIVIGSGVTGSEFVHAFTELGVKVTVLSATDRMLPREDRDAAHVLENVLSERGVTVLTNAKADKVIRTDNGVEVVLSNGQIIEGSHALMTVGSIPNTKNLGLEDLGVKLSPSGHIEVDKVSRTNIRGIYAAGDCTGVFPLASVAAMQGRIAMYHYLGEGVTPIRLKNVASATFTRPEIASVGVSHASIEREEVPATVVVLPLASNARAKMSALRRGFVKLFCNPETGIVIGGVIVAPNASELIASVALAVDNQLTVETLASTFNVYPSLSGSVFEAARRMIKHYELEN